MTDRAGAFFADAPRTDLVFCARERNDLAERDVAASILYV